MCKERAGRLRMPGELWSLCCVTVHNVNRRRVLVVELAIGRQDGKVFWKRDLNVGGQKKIKG